MPATSNLFSVLFPERAGWDLKAVLLGKTVDLLALLVWAKTKAARHGHGRPKSVVPFGKPARAGTKPTASPLRVVRERMARLHRRRAAEQPSDPLDRARQIKDLLTREDKKEDKKPHGS